MGGGELGGGGGRSGRSRPVFMSAPVWAVRLRVGARLFRLSPRRLPLCHRPLGVAEHLQGGPPLPSSPRVDAGALTRTVFFFSSFAPRAFTKILFFFMLHSLCPCPVLPAQPGVRRRAPAPADTSAVEGQPAWRRAGVGPPGDVGGGRRSPARSPSSTPFLPPHPRGTCRCDRHRSRCQYGGWPHFPAVETLALGRLWWWWRWRR